MNSVCECLFCFAFRQPPIFPVIFSNFEVQSLNFRRRMFTRQGVWDLWMQSWDELRLWVSEIVWFFCWRSLTFSALANCYQSERECSEWGRARSSVALSQTYPVSLISQKVWKSLKNFELKQQNHPDKFSLLGKYSQEFCRRSCISLPERTCRMFLANILKTQRLLTI